MQHLHIDEIHDDRLHAAKDIILTVICFVAQSCLLYSQSFRAVVELLRCYEAKQKNYLYFNLKLL